MEPRGIYEIFYTFYCSHQIEGEGCVYNCPLYKWGVYGFDSSNYCWPQSGHLISWRLTVWSRFQEGGAIIIFIIIIIIIIIIIGSENMHSLHAEACRDVGW